MSRSLRFTSHASEIRQPVAYRNSNNALSRRATESTPVTVDKRESTSSRESGFGTPVGTRTPSTREAGLSGLTFSATRCVCSMRTAANRRAMLATASPRDCKCLTNASTSSSVHIATSVFRFNKNSSYRAKSRRYDDTVLAARPRSTVIHNRNDSASGESEMSAMSSVSVRDWDTDVLPTSTRMRSSHQ